MECVGKYEGGFRHFLSPHHPLRNISSILWARTCSFDMEIVTARENLRPIEILWSKFSDCVIYLYLQMFKNFQSQHVNTQTQSALTVCMILTSDSVVPSSRLNRLSSRNFRAEARDEG